MPKSTTPELFITEIEEPHNRKNFERLRDHFEKENQLSSFKFVEFSVSGAVTNHKVPHTLSFVPRDLIRTRKTGAGSVTFNRHLFDASNLDITTTGPAKVRLFAGAFHQDEEVLDDEVTDTETWN